MRSKNVHCGCQVQITTFICATVPPVDVFLNKTLFSDNVEVTVSRKVEKEKSWFLPQTQSLQPDGGNF